MIERAVDRFEEGAAIGAIVLVAKLRGRIVEPRVGPGIVATEHLIMREQGHGGSHEACALRETTQSRSHDPIAQPTR